VVHHCRLVGVWDGVLEVDELSAEGVLVAREDAHVGFAEGPADDLQGAALVWKGRLWLCDGPGGGGGCSLFNNTPSTNLTKDTSQSVLQTDASTILFSSSPAQRRRLLFFESSSSSKNFYRQDYIKMNRNYKITAYQEKSAPEGSPGRVPERKRPGKGL
jgi:hypothetical protein